MAIVSSAEMGRAVAVESKRVGLPEVRSADEFREVLAEALESVEADERAGTLLRAAGVRIRFEFPDIGLVLNVAAAEDPHRHLRWAFSDDVDWKPKLELEMNADVANAYLQGQESLAIALARRRVRCQGESRVALLYVPAIRLICDPYRRVVSERHPHLAVA